MARASEQRVNWTSEAHYQATAQRNAHCVQPGDCMCSKQINYMASWYLSAQHTQDTDKLLVTLHLQTQPHNWKRCIHLNCINLLGGGGGVETKNWSLATHSRCWNCAARRALPGTDSTAASPPAGVPAGPAAASWTAGTPAEEEESGWSPKSETAGTREARPPRSLHRRPAEVWAPLSQRGTPASSSQKVPATSPRWICPSSSCAAAAGGSGYRWWRRGKRVAWRTPCALCCTRARRAGTALCLRTRWRAEPKLPGKPAATQLSGGRTRWGRCASSHARWCVSRRASRPRRGSPVSVSIQTSRTGTFWRKAVARFQHRPRRGHSEGA